MIGTQLRDALSHHPVAEMAEYGELDALSERPENIRSNEKCTDVLNYLESKIVSIEGQLETSRIAAQQRGANDSYLDWHTRAHHALTMTRFRYERVKKQRHLIFLEERERAKQLHAERVANAERKKAEARASNAATQLEIVKIAADRSVHKLVCGLVRERFGDDVHNDLFDAAKIAASHLKSQPHV